MKDNHPARSVAYMGLLFALSLVLSLVESAVPIPGPVPGIKLGLSNVVVMYCVFFLGGSKGYLLAFLKSLFVLLTRGFIASCLSLSGGLLSVSAMLLLWKALRGAHGYTPLSICGAMGHNLGQLFCAVLVVGMPWDFFFYYLPPLLAVGVLVGYVTSLVMRVVSPYLKKIPIGAQAPWDDDSKPS